MTIYNEDFWNALDELVYSLGRKRREKGGRHHVHR